MKFYCKQITILLFLLFNAVHFSNAQEQVKGIKQVIDLTPDELGNANILVTMKLNASQWDAFKKSIGSNTSVFKWNMQKALPKYYLTDFKVDQDEMERTFKINFKALGLVEIGKNGKWLAKLESKDPDITKLSDREYVMTENLNENGVLIEQTQKLHLPAGVSNVKLEKDSFGKAELTYTTGGGILSKILMGIGILFIAAGGFFLFKAFR